MPQIVVSDERSQTTTIDQLTSRIDDRPVVEASGRRRTCHRDIVALGAAHRRRGAPRSASASRQVDPDRTPPRRQLLGRRAVRARLAVPPHRRRIPRRRARRPGHRGHARRQPRFVPCHAWLNHVAGYSLDALGGSSWLWRFKHNTLHHGNPNVEGVDSDISQAPFARLAPMQPLRPWHRWQHVYLWFLYGFFAMKNLVFGDFRTLAAARIGPKALRTRPGPTVLARVLAGKFLHLGWAVVVPLLTNPWWGVLGSIW